MNKIIVEIENSDDPVTLYNICKNNDKSFDGIFYMGVHTTEIYCLPSCKAKTPLLKNVKFYNTRDDAIAAGLRGCKRCRSEFFPLVQPQWFNLILEYLSSNLSTKIKEEQLEQLSKVNISTIQRYFKEYLKYSVMSYHRKLRLEYAQKLIKEGVDLLDIPYFIGYESMSGFRDAFFKEYGCNPGELNDK